MKEKGKSFPSCSFYFKLNDKRMLQEVTAGETLVQCHRHSERQTDRQTLCKTHRHSERHTDTQKVTARQTLVQCHHRHYVQNMFFSLGEYLLLVLTRDQILVKMSKKVCLSDFGGMLVHCLHYILNTQLH